MCFFRWAVPLITFPTLNICFCHLTPVVFSHKCVCEAGIVIDIMTGTQHIMAHYGGINLSTLTRVMVCSQTEPYHNLNQFWLTIGKVQLGDTSVIIYYCEPLGKLYLIRRLEINSGELAVRVGVGEWRNDSGEMAVAKLLLTV